MQVVELSEWAEPKHVVSVVTGLWEVAMDTPLELYVFADTVAIGTLLTGEKTGFMGGVFEKWAWPGAWETWKCSVGGESLWEEFNELNSAS